MVFCDRDGKEIRYIKEYVALTDVLGVQLYCCQAV